MIIGIINYDDVVEVCCNLCGGYYKVDDLKSYECEDVV